MAPSSHLVLVWLLSRVLCSCASPWQSMSTGSVLRVEDYRETFLVSPDATFSCGFYRVHGDAINAFSFSIWLAAAADRAVVWTANRGSPVYARGATVSLSHDGNLVLADVNGTSVWESRTSSGKHTTAALLDTGNLVIRDAGGRTVWESFDSPTDTLLPGQLLTRDRRLVAGYHSLYFDNDNVLRMLYDGPEITSIYWPSPDYNALQNGRSRFNSTRIAVLDDAGNFVSSDGFRIEASDSGLGIKRRITIDYDGNFRMYSLNASTGGWTVTGQGVIQMCYVHGLCGKNGLCEYSLGRVSCKCPPGYVMNDTSDWTKGCRPTFAVECRGSAEDFEFAKVPHGDYYGFDLGSNKSVSLAECRRECKASCACMSFTYKPGDGLCYFKGMLYNGQVYPYFPGDNYMKLPKGALGSALPGAAGLKCTPNGAVMHLGTADMYGKKRESINWAYFYVFAGILGAFELAFMVTCWCFLLSKHDIPKSMEEGYKMVTSQFRRFTYGELREATGKFKEEIGRGGAGVVYRGLLEDKKVVAVKKLSDVTRSEEEFWAEVTLIGRINHINLVRMWGFCSEGKHRLLVYEYVDNESLDKYLFGDAERLLGWSQRFKIAVGTARGLAYLHHECLEWVVHCDVKPENILLTRDFEAKIADFGLAKLARRDSSSFNFTHMRGTMGYMAPEWALNLPISAKADVYSFGVVLLEIVAGSRVSAGEAAVGGEAVGFAQFVQEVRRVVAAGGEEDMETVVDGRLSGHYNPEQAAAMAAVAISCLEERSKRPTMDEVVKALAVYDEEDDHPAYYSW